MTAPDVNADVRARFEAWATDEGYAVERYKDSYQAADTRNAWWGFQAALAQNTQREAEGEVKRGDRHAGCGGFWCDLVEAEYKKPPRVTLDESSVERYVKLGLMCDECGAERPDHAERASVPEWWVLPSDTGPFADWLAREMPPGTVISNPAWWAPRILRQIAHLAAAPSQPKDAEVDRG